MINPIINLIVAQIALNNARMANTNAQLIIEQNKKKELDNKKKNSKQK